MDENNKVIQKMLQQQGYQATESAQQAITDFAILYAKKLITKCLKGNQKNSISLQDVRFTYEVMNKMHSLDYQAELQQRRMKMINYMNTDLNAQKFQKSPADVNTVSLYPNNQNPHMRTSWEYQLAFENS